MVDKSLSRKNVALERGWKFGGEQGVGWLDRGL